MAKPVDEVAMKGGRVAATACPDTEIDHVGRAPYRQAQNFHGLSHDHMARPPEWQK